ELTTTDHKAAFRFYHELLGWEQTRVHDMGSMGEYLLFGQGGRELGGMFSPPPGQGPGTHWLPYVGVGSAAQVADAAKASGGKVAHGPMEVPGGSWIAQLFDPQGALIAVVQAPAAQPAQAKPAAPRPKPAPKPAAAPEPSAAKPAPAKEKPAAAASAS